MLSPTRGSAGAEKIPEQVQAAILERGLPGV